MVSPCLAKTIREVDRAMLAATEEAPRALEDENKDEDVSNR